MKRRLLLARHFSFAYSCRSEYDEFIFLLDDQSKIPAFYLEKVKTKLIKYFPNMSFALKSELELSENDSVLDFDSYDEFKLSNGKLNQTYQNRLFDDLPFDCPDGFSSFRKKAEKILPNYFSQVISPFDEETIAYLDTYFNSTHPKSYFETRNKMIGDFFSSKFSDLLSWGLVDVRYLYNRIKDYEGEFGSNKSTYWLIFELLWREFFYWHYQKHETLFFSENGIQGIQDFSDFKNFTIEELNSIESPLFFKCALKELETTGFLSNRARQIFASVWLNDLNLPWRSGAKLFEEHLVDYDVYSNYGNWMYLSGVGVDPRGKRYFNVKKQLEMYDKNGDYIKFWSARL